jgi:hypothetical protein
MKTLHILAACAAAAALLTPVASSAQSAAAAMVQKDVGCVAFLPEVLNVLLSTNDSIVVSNDGGNTQLTCHFDIPYEHLPERAVQARGFVCTVLDKNSVFINTTDTRFTATPGGKAHLSCQYKGD